MIRPTRSAAFAPVPAHTPALSLAYAPKLALGLALALVLGLAACTAGGSGSIGTTAPGSSASTAPAGPTRLRIVAAFYPLEFAAARVGGSHTEVSTLTKPGTEPHDLELTPADVARLSSADVVITLRGFQPALDAAASQQASASTFDVAGAANLDLTGQPPDEQDPGQGDPEPAVDQHFWLDPQRYAAVATAIGDRLAQTDPANAAAYRANAATFAAELAVLDGEFAAGLRNCSNRTLVTSHAAFGYLARRYDLSQVPIAGLSPDQEPSPRQLAQVAELVASTRVGTIYTEPLVDPAFAQTVAGGTGAAVATLDPIEGITASSAGPDYPAVMRANLATLRSGQGCS